jgi:metal-responsive CopG/Arc/MetJ family transcriptional regulator
MAVLTLVGDTGYTRSMAKVLVSIPDELLRDIDLRSKELGETRSGYLRGLVEADLEEGERRGRQEAKRLMDLIRAEFHQGEEPIDAAKLIREDRESH